MVQSFYSMPTLDLAKALIGKSLIHESSEGTTSGLIVETEAYIGPHDKASHSYGGRRTPRVEPMYGPPAHAYIYLIYGMNHCFNVVSGKIGAPEAVLIRALHPQVGVELMKKRRSSIKRQVDLTNGPGKLCAAMGITRDQNEFNLITSPLYIEDVGFNPQPEDILSGPRIGIPYAEEAVHYPWRFWLKGDEYVSKKK